MILFNFCQRKSKTTAAKISNIINRIEFDSGNPFIFHVNELIGWINGLTKKMSIIHLETIERRILALSVAITNGQFIGLSNKGRKDQS